MGNGTVTPKQYQTRTEVKVEYRTVRIGEGMTGDDDRNMVW